MVFCKYRTILITLTLIFSGNLFAANVVRLISGEKEPYIGESLNNNGYVYEVVKEALKREGYQVEIRFYPWARANHLANNGKFDGILPVRPGSFPTDKFEFSAPFPGDIIGLLKRKSDDSPLNPLIPNDRKHLSHALANKTIGVVRGSDMVSSLDINSGVQFSEVSQELYNLDMLHAGRIDFALTDKYTATRLMIDKRPHYIGALEFVQPPLAEHTLHIAFSKHTGRSKQLTEAFNRGLLSMTKDNTLEEILAAHGLLFKQHKSKGQKSLIIGSVNNPDMKIMRSLSKEFEALHPEVAIEWIEMEESVLRRRLLSDLALNDGQFDVMMIGNYETPIWAKMGWIHPFSGLPSDYQIDDIFPVVREALNFKNTLFALPFYAEGVMTYYRKDLFKSAGIQMPEQPTYSEIKQFAAALHDAENQVYGICLRGKPGWGENMATVTSLVHAFGGRWFDPSWQPQLSSTEWKEALTYYKDLISKYGPPHPESLGYTENLKLFADGHCGIWIDATVAAGQLYNPRFSKISDKVAFALAPTQKTTTNWLWVWALAIPESSKNKMLAQSFISWATSQNYIRMIGERYGWISVPPGTRKSTYLESEYQKAASFSQPVANALKQKEEEQGLLHIPYDRVQFVAIPEYTSIGGSVGNLVADVLKGRISISEAQTRAQNLTKKQMILSGYIKSK